MKFYLLVLSSLALLCARVFLPSGEDSDVRQSESYKQVVFSLDKFAGKFYSQLAAAHPKKNLFFSPLSIAAALTVLSVGAKSETHRQILEGLGFDPSVIAAEDISKGFQQLLRVINQRPPGIVLNTTNACFVDKELRLLQKFRDDLNWFQFEVISTDFSKCEEAKNQINAYVEEKTSGLIKELLDGLDPDTELALTNTISFKGAWQDVFDKRKTYEGDFHVDKDTVVKVQMMNRHGQYLVNFLENCVVVEVPYKGNVSAVFIIPDEGKMEDVEKAFHSGSLRNWMKELNSTRIDLALPRFSASSTIDLTDVLRKLGITEVFSNNADLSGITEGRKLKVSKATHKAMVSVDEEGTEAAAVTAIGFMAMSVPPQVTANRPFLMTIIDKANDVSLFTGRIMNPQQ